VNPPRPGDEPWAPSSTTSTATRVIPSASSATSRGTGSTTRFTGYVPACDCGWTGTGRYEPTEAGYDAARGEWEHDHARPLLEHVIPDQVQHLLRDTLRTLDNLAAQRPHATAKALPTPRRGAYGHRTTTRRAPVGRQPPSRRPVLLREYPAAALASVSSHEQVQAGPGPHAIGMGPASPDGRGHRLGEDRRSFGPHRPAYQAAVARFEEQVDPERRPSSAERNRRAEHAMRAHDTARSAFRTGASAPAGLLNGDEDPP